MKEIRFPNPLKVSKYDATLGGITAISQKHRFGGAFFMPFSQKITKIFAQFKKLLYLCSGFQEYRISIIEFV